MKKRILLYLILSLLLILSSCESPSDSNKAYERGDIISITKTVSYTVNNLNQLLALFEIDIAFTLEYNIDVYRIVYHSEDADGNGLTLSGALMVPQNSDPLSILTMNHGTVTGRTQVASVSPLNSSEGALGLITTSIGYVTLIPDYPGFGSSTEMHPYVHANSLVISVVDFMRAGFSFCQDREIDLNGKLFLGGYSEGGYVTMATHKEIEQKYATEFSLTAVSPMAGPHNLYWMAHHIFAKTTYPNPAYLAFLITAYDDVYGWNRLGEIFNEPYASRMTDYFDGSRTYGEINSQLPDSISVLFKQSFINSFLAGNETVFENVLSENTLLGWDPIAPIRMYHGDADSTVYLKNSIDAKTDFESRGANNIELIIVSGGTHASSAEEAINGMIAWFNSF